MVNITFAAQFYFGYYYFFPTKSNSDLCCNEFTEAVKMYSHTLHGSSPVRRVFF